MDTDPETFGANPRERSADKEAQRYDEKFPPVKALANQMWLPGGNFSPSAGSEIFCTLDKIKGRAEKLLSLAVDACRKERWEAYAWVIRESRRARVAWDNLASARGLSAEVKSGSWGAKNPGMYAVDLDMCRSAIGLPVVLGCLPMLPGSQDRAESYLENFYAEIDEDERAKSPYLPNDQEHLQREGKA